MIDPQWKLWGVQEFMAFAGSFAWTLVVFLWLMISTSGAASVTLLSAAGQDTINTKEGETISFVCSSGDLDGPEILQINDNIDDPASSRISAMSNDSASTAYQFAAVVREDNGTLFQCFVNTRPSNYLTLIVDFPPKYVPDAYNYTVIEGTPLRIPLQLDALKAVTSFNWTKDGADIQSNTGTTVGANFIDFGAVGREDAGTYRVSAEDSVGTGDALLTLQVYYSPEFVAGSGVIYRSAVIGGNFSLDCSWSANPTGSLQTTFQDRPSFPGTFPGNVMIDENSQLITTSGAVAGNRGQYICTVTNIIATSQLVYNLLVGDLPMVVLEMIAVPSSEGVDLQGTYTENNIEDPVYRIYIIVGNTTMTATPDDMSSFSLSFDGLAPGTTYTVKAIAENAIGNGTVQSPVTFATVPVADAPENSGYVHMINSGMLFLLAALVVAICL